MMVAAVVNMAVTMIPEVAGQASLKIAEVVDTTTDMA